MSGTLEQIAAEWARALKGLASRFGPEEVLSSLIELGVEITDEVESDSALFAAAEAVGTHLDSIDAALDELRTATDPIDVIDAGQNLIAACGQAVAAVEDLCAAIAALPGSVDSNASNWLVRLLDLAVVDMMGASVPVAALAEIAGVIEQDGDVISLHLDRLPDLLANPADYFWDRIGWGTGQIDATVLLPALQLAVRRIGLPAFVENGVLEAWSVDVSVDDGVLTVRVVMPISTEYQRVLELGETSGEVTISSAAELATGATLTWEPGSTPVIAPDPIASAPPELSFTADIAGTAPQPVTILGIPGGPRVVADGADVTIALTGTWDQAAGQLRLDNDFGVEIHGVQLILAPGEDSFVGGFIAAADQPAGTDLALRWDPQRGPIVDGAGTLGISKYLGPGDGLAFVEAWTFEIGFEQGSIVAVAAADVGGNLGPLSFTISDIGVELSADIVGTGGNLGPIDAAIDLHPPSGIGLALEAEGASGAGYLGYDDSIGRWSGMASLQILAVGIDALTVIDTRLPNNPDGWAFFASLSATFPSLQLGFGFTLNGVGGLIALNRTIDPEALGLGVREGALDALMFPEDPLQDAQFILSEIDNYFPIAEGNTVIGPMVEIGWGTPTIVSAEIGVLISIPDGIISILGSLGVVLPNPDVALLSLKMDVLGIIDLGEGTITVLASVYDSWLLETIRLSGDMGMYASFVNNPYFLFSIGGYHPDFQPPSYLPAALQDLRRLRADLPIAPTVELTITGYFAITSNTLQFGAGVELVASMEFLKVTYTASGEAHFDALLVFSPFSFTADMGASVAVTAGNKELTEVDLDLYVEGPEPWYAEVRASFKFFGIKVPFNFDVGAQAPDEAKELHDVLADVIAALEGADAWQPAAPAIAAGVTLADTGDDERLWVRPDYRLAARQNIAPLDRTLGKFGQYAPQQELLAIEGAGTGNLAGEWETVQDYFSPAQFTTMGKNAKLAAPSYELMNSGVTFGTTGVTVPDGEAVAAPSGHEEVLWVDDEPDRRGLVDWRLASLGTSLLATAAADFARQLAPVATATAFQVHSTAYTVVRTSDGEKAAAVLTDYDAVHADLSYDAAHDIIDQAAQADPGESGRLRAVPTYTLEPA